MRMRGGIVQQRENTAHQPQDEYKHISVYEKQSLPITCAHINTCYYQQIRLKVMLLLLSSHLSTHIWEMTRGVLQYLLTQVCTEDSFSSPSFHLPVV